ncbi:glutamyl-tRNA reductase, partial [Acinetobacter variabilis]|uniref:glutamyl-tRNA reductase n=1 Tax=Acinetobacter variabilis TaxID=70346 RepID=UPI0028A19447
MSFFALGVNHQTASVELREKIAFNPEKLSILLAEQSQHPVLNDMVVVSTCNRTEVYAMSDNVDMVLNWLAQTKGIDPKQLQNHVYRYENAQAVTHLMRVASGLDSLMLGEPQILGQVKTALSLAKESKTVSQNLNRIFEHAFYAAKRVRSETAVGSHAVSMGYAVAQLALQVFSRPEQLTVMVVAAGEMNSLVAKHLAEMGVGKIIICNRTRARAENLAQEIAHRADVEIIDFDQLAANLHRADVISSCTGSLHQVIHYPDVKAALKKRRYQQMLLVDLAVPRDIDPKVEKLDGVYLYGVDDLQSVIDENLAQRRQAAVEAEVMVNQLAT